MSELEVIGVLEGTDKTSSFSWAWDYLRHYDRLFQPFRSSAINVLEIGCAGGASLRMWKRYFDKATIIGVDINQECRRLADERTIIRIGSQDDPEFLHQIVTEFPPSIIIDDGSHLAHHMISTFEILFPALAPGGIYVFEDLAFHFPEGRQYLGADAHKGLSPQTIYEYLSPFMRVRAAEVLAPEGSWGFKKYAFEHIDEITIFGGVIAIRKRKSVDIQEHLAYFAKHFPDDPSPDVVSRYAQFALKHGAPLEPVLQVVESSVGSNPDHAEIRLRKVELLRALGRHEEAARAES